MTEADEGRHPKEMVPETWSACQSYTATDEVYVMSSDGSYELWKVIGSSKWHRVGVVK